mmetsp:Transcript_8963/g.22091  ORF Transcript_8963/g.22091 Transcript_8963/m.22091 type:complete len:200 (+) Transcript_8963:40-639(+)
MHLFRCPSFSSGRIHRRMWSMSFSSRHCFMAAIFSLALPTSKSVEMRKRRRDRSRSPFTMAQIGKPPSASTPRLSSWSFSLRRDVCGRPPWRRSVDWRADSCRHALSTGLYASPSPSGARFSSLLSLFPAHSSFRNSGFSISAITKLVSSLSSRFSLPALLRWFLRTFCKRRQPATTATASFKFPGKNFSITTLRARTN